MNTDLEKTKHQNEALQAQLSKIGQAFGHEPKSEEPKPDAWYDNVLTRALELEQAGQPVPMTVQLANQLHQTQQQQQPLLEQIAQLKQQVQNLSNPDMHHDQQTFVQLDSMLTKKFSENFQKPDPNHEDAVAKMVAGEIKRLKTENKDVYNKLRRDPTMQQQLVDYYFNKSIPDSYRQLAQEHHIQNAPLTDDEIAQAFAAAKQIQDPALRSEAMSAARAKMYERMMTGKKGESWQSKMQKYTKGMS